jgi:putative hydrolase of the HAD superfamily
MNPSVRAVFLDVDDTLVDYAPAARAAFAAALGEDASYDQWLSLDHYERWLAGEFDGFEDFRVRRMADFLALLGRSADAERAAAIERHRFDGLAEYYTLFDDALPCVGALRECGVLIGLITNNESVHQRDKIKRVGLDGLFDAVVISDEVGVAKPNEAIFQHACGLLDVTPAQALHVGDNLVADALGAHAAGLHGVWLDRHRTHDGRPLDVSVIGDLSGVTGLLG